MKKTEKAIVNGIPYEIVRSSRKTVSLQVIANGEVRVRAPMKMRKEDIDAFVLKHKDWLLKNMAYMNDKSRLERANEERKDEMVALAKEVLPMKVEYFSKIMNVSPKSVKITSAKTRWGSCSSKNALCFSWRLMLRPEKAIDYVVIHELSHILHHDHSKEFWQTVEHYMPDYREAKALLNQMHNS